MTTIFDFNNLIFLIICFFPGYLSFNLAKYLTSFAARSDFEKSAISTVLGFVIFSITLLLSKLLKIQETNLMFYIFVPWLLILPTGTVWSIIHSKDLILRIFRVLKLSRKTGYPDCWIEILSEPKANFVRIYLDNGSLYTGWVDFFSDNPPHEIVINPERVVYNDGSLNASFNPLILTIKNILKMNILFV